MSLIEYLLLGIGGVLLFIVYYIVNRDAQMQRQYRSVASALEDLHRQLYRVEKGLKERIDEVALSVPEVDAPGMRRQLEQQIREFAAPIAGSVEQIEAGVGRFQGDMEKRLQHLEEGMRHLTMPASISGLDDEKIISLYKQGVDLDTIARELRLSKAEVEFVLKLNKIR